MMRLIGPCLAALALLVPAAAEAREAKKDKEKEKGKKYALLVGVKEYDHSALSNLRFAENDIEELAKVLRDQAGYHEVRILTATRGKKVGSLKPTAQNIREQLKKLTDKTAKNDTLLVALSGHGVQLGVLDSDSKKQKDENFFCPTDARLRDTRDLAELKKTMIPLGELFKSLDESGAGTKLLLIDACRNDPRAAARNVSVDNLPRLPRGTAALFSCKGGERAYESDKLGKGHGVFFHHVIEALKGKAKSKKGEVTWASLTEYVHDKVPEEVPALIGGGAKQTPYEVKNLTGRSPTLIGPSEAKIWYDKGVALVQEDTVTVEDYAQAASLFHDAADEGYGPAMTALASLYTQGRGVQRDDKEAARWYFKAAEKNDPRAMRELANLYDRGRGVEKDAKEAMKWMRKAADGGDPEAMREMARRCELGRDGIDKDLKAAVAYYRKAAGGGDAEAMYHLGRLHEDGKGVELSLKLAAEWYGKAADKQIGPAMHRLGHFHLSGTVFSKNAKNALAWFLKAAAKNHTPSMLALADLHRRGVGAEKADPKAADEWLNKAADRGDPEAIRLLRKGKDESR